MLWLSLTLIVSLAAGVPTTPVELNCPLFDGTTNTGPGNIAKNLHILERGYTLTKVIVSKTSANQMDGFEMYFTPNVGGAD